MSGNDYHQISAFAVAKSVGNDANTAYSVYDNGELQITRCVSIQNVSEHRALLMAVWSATRYCMEHLPQYQMSLYCTEPRVPNELTKVWYNEAKPTDFEDADRIESIIKDCCNISQTAFSVIKPDEGGVFADYGRRIRELIELINRDK